MIIELAVDLINLLIRALGFVANTIVSILPTSPFISFLNADIPYIDTLNWVIPFGTLLTITEAWLVAIAIYYLVQVILRWIKVIE